MKKNCCIVFAVVFVLGLFMVTANAQALDEEALKSKIKEEIKEEMKHEGGLLAGIQEHIKFSGLIEVGAVWQDIDYKGAGPTEPEEKSDICLTTLELVAEAEVNEWVKVVAVLLYEDPTFEPETSVEMDVATVTIGNTEEYPLYFTAGKMYVPFGALLTHFPDDPLIDAPLTLVFGETSEKVLLVGVEHEGFSVSGYVFNGDVDEFGEDNSVESYGVDANFAMDEEDGLNLLIGASYISNITDSDGLSEALEDYVDELEDIPGVLGAGLKDYVAGAVGYVHVGFDGFFVDGEYMTALDEFDVTVMTATGKDTRKGDDQPAVWNIEAGMNLGESLEIVLKYAGSSEAEFLGFPETRYGICFNQELYKDVIASLGYLRDDYDEDKVDDQRDQRDLVFAQIAIEF